MLSNDLLVKLKHKKEMHRGWNQRYVSWEEYRATAQMYRNGTKKAKAQLELSLEREAKSHNRYAGQKRKIKENVPVPHPPLYPYK